MKITRLVKLALVAVFAINSGLVGVIGFCWECYQERPSYTFPVTPQQELELWHCLQERIEVAEAKVGNDLTYGCDNCREDFELYQKKKKELGIPEEFECHNSNTFFGRLQSLMPCKELNRTQEYFDQLRDAKREKVNWGVYCDWAVGFLIAWYKSNLAPVFLLFAVWYWERNKFPSPLYLVVLVVGYPITIPLKIGRYWYGLTNIQKDAQESYRTLTHQHWAYQISLRVEAETEIRRRDDNLFRSLSDEEVEKIRRFSLGLISKAELLRQLSVPKHGFWLAFLVTIFLMTLPSRILLRDIAVVLGGVQIAVESISVQHLPRDKICDDGGGGIQEDYSKFFWEPLRFERQQAFARWLFKEFVFRFSQFVREISHVPKLPAVGASWQVSLNTNAN